MKQHYQIIIEGRAFITCKSYDQAAALVEQYRKGKPDADISIIPVSGNR